MIPQLRLSPFLVIGASCSGRKAIAGLNKLLCRIILAVDFGVPGYNYGNARDLGSKISEHFVCKSPSHPPSRACDATLSGDI